MDDEVSGHHGAAATVMDASSARDRDRIGGARATIATTSAVIIPTAAACRKTIVASRWPMGLERD